MPAVSADTVALPRIPTVDLTAPTAQVPHHRAVGLRGRGVPGAARLRRRRPGRPGPLRAHGPDGRGRLRPGRAQGHPRHPHRGFETVTYMIDGVFRHQDSNGGGGLITDGDTQWMTAGGGSCTSRRCPRRWWSGRAVPRLPALGQPAGPAWQMTSTALPGHPRCAVELLAARRRRPGAGHRRRGRRAQGPGVTYTPISLLHATLAPGAEPGCPGGPTSTPWCTSWPGRDGRDQAPAGPHRPARRLRARRRGDGRGRRRPGEPQPLAGRADPRWPAHPRAGGRLCPVRDEHPRRAHPGLRGLPGRPPGHDPGRAPPATRSWATPPANRGPEDRVAGSATARRALMRWASRGERRQAAGGLTRSRRRAVLVPGLAFGGDGVGELGAQDGRRWPPGTGPGRGGAGRRCWPGRWRSGGRRGAGRSRRSGRRAHGVDAAAVAEDLDLAGGQNRSGRRRRPGG